MIRLNVRDDISDPTRYIPIIMWRTNEREKRVKELRQDAHALVYTYINMQRANDMPQAAGSKMPEGYYSSSNRHAAPAAYKRWEGKIFLHSFLQRATLKLFFFYDNNKMLTCS